MLEVSVEIGGEKKCISSVDVVSMTPLDTSKSWVSCFQQSVLAQAFVLLMGLSREWLLLSTLLKHETLQKP